MDGKKEGTKQVIPSGFRFLSPKQPWSNLPSLPVDHFECTETKYNFNQAKSNTTDIPLKKKVYFEIILERQKQY